jgi:hypothetical protein
VKVPFRPTLFVPDKNGSHTLFSPDNPIKLSPIKPGNMKEARMFIDQYQNAKGFNVYGMTNYVSQFIGEEYPGELEYDRDAVNVTSIVLRLMHMMGFHIQKDAMPLSMQSQLKIQRIRHIIHGGWINMIR